ncbi:MAG: helix-turn-helix domain-containing protein [Phenylobacterium sp.]|uniref:MerR family transcriptional regulator n=1 Tax=Phenylobacterium sp. TaxID=1871053 RepID=UPI001A35418F|nr:helix-turn-helix domain-containing protein [Phenylobacterium sp.]MBJ7412477.1 helix-turn-helix domain-containing protein [Phenylobacterium sp.]
MAHDGDKDLSIGELSRRTGVKVTTIRFYESIGLLPEPPRSSGDRRLYNSVHERRLAFVRHARELGFEMADIRTLLELSDTPDMPCGRADEIARGHLASIDEKIGKLTALREELVRMTDACANTQVASCRVIEALAEPTLHG